MKRWTPQQFRQALAGLGMTQAAFCQMTGISQRALSSYLSGERRVPSLMPFLIQCVKLYQKYGDVT